MKDAITYTVIFIVLVLWFCVVSSKHGSKSFEKLEYRIGGTKKESMSKLLSRLNYANHYRKRISIAGIAFFIAVVLTVFSSIVLLEKIPSGKVFSQNILVCFVLTFAFLNFCEFHFYNLVHKQIDNTINVIYEKLKLKKKKVEIPDHIPIKQSLGEEHNF